MIPLHLSFTYFSADPWSAIPGRKIIRYPINFHLSITSTNCYVTIYFFSKNLQMLVALASTLLSINYCYHLTVITWINLSITSGPLFQQLNFLSVSTDKSWTKTDTELNCKFSFLFLLICNWFLRLLLFFIKRTFN
jgi:hypothetical protein